MEYLESSSRKSPCEWKGIYYGGWVTPELVDPFKRTPGTEMW
jgi:hypothetical protein